MTEMLRALDGASSWMQSETARLLVTRRGPASGTFALGWATGLPAAGRRMSSRSVGPAASGSARSASW